MSALLVFEPVPIAWNMHPSLSSGTCPRDHDPRRLHRCRGVSRTSILRTEKGRRERYSDAYDAQKAHHVPLDSQTPVLFLAVIQASHHTQASKRPRSKFRSMTTMTTTTSALLQGQNLVPPPTLQTSGSFLLCHCMLPSSIAPGIRKSRNSSHRTYASKLAHARHWTRRALATSLQREVERLSC